MMNLSLNELKQIAKMRRIKGYKNRIKKPHNAKKENIKGDLNKLRDFKTKNKKN